MLAEADESDGSFLKLAPTIAIVTNIDPEHMDHYKTFDALTAAFCQFCSRLPFYGLAILCGEQAQTVALSKKIKNRYVLYGFSPKHDYNAQNISYQGTTCCYDLYKKNVFVDQIQVNVPGKHNILNSLAAVAAGDEIGISVSNIKKGLAGFQGVGRRLEVLFKNKNMTVIDDYGHHPSEIAATIKTVKHTFPGRLVVMFQPHRYTRTRDLFPDFVTCFDRADHLFITDIYAASEPPIRGVNSQKLVTAINKHKQRSVVYLPKAHQNLDQVVQAMRPGDVLLSLGAGDITKMVRNIARELARIFI
ncbi:MAG: hypothetical protein ACD_62C00475G0001 [uncultured bacterium]|nr:MAG: hypothetical protein ACD_62C00475G0001 [uncultured bacterium]